MQEVRLQEVGGRAESGTEAENDAGAKIEGWGGFMKAIVCTAYGGTEVMQRREVATPEPGPQEIRVRVHAATVTLGDCELRTFKFPLLLWLPLRLYMGVLRPRINILGQEFAGVVEAVGEQVTRFKPGDEVFGPTTMKMGAYGEYLCLPEQHAIHHKPPGLSFAEVVTLPVGGINALHFLTKAQVKPGDRVLINGAGGSIGTYAIQIAHMLGAEVSAVDHTDKRDLLSALGAKETIDYTREDFTRRGQRYDVIIDVVGGSHFGRCIDCLNPGGRYVLGNPRATGMLRGVWIGKTTDKTVLFELAAHRPEDFQKLLGWMQDGKIKAVIDREYSVDNLPEAHDYVEAGHKQGNVVINMASH